MPIEISDTLPDELESVLSFCGAPGKGEQKWRPMLSLTAHEGRRLVGALVCHARGHNGSVKRMLVRGTDADHGIATQLIDKAMRKLQAWGIRRCRISVAQPNTADGAIATDTSTFWQSVAWPDKPDLAGAGHVIRASGGT